MNTAGTHPLRQPPAPCDSNPGGAPSVPPPVYDSANRPHPFWEELREIWRYRNLATQFVGRDIKTRYKRSFLGMAWTMLNPLLMMIVLTLVFSHLFRFELPRYPVYLLSALVLWNFFAQSTTAAMSQLVWGGALLTRIYMPRTIFAISSATAACSGPACSPTPRSISP